MKKTLQIIIFILFSANSFAQNDSLLYEFGEKMNVYRNTSNNTYKIKKGNRIIWNKLKFVYPTFGYLQVLDKKNLYFYIDEKGKKSRNISINVSTCGTVPHYTYEIIETANKYILTKDETFYDHENLEKPVMVDSISKIGIDKIYFYNNERKINFTENTFIFNATKVFPQVLIIEKDNKKGIFYEGELTFYDDVKYEDGIFKVKQNNLEGYYKLTQIRYKKLDGFSSGLTKFELENGKTGFIDKDGNEYYD